MDHEITRVHRSESHLNAANIATSDGLCPYCARELRLQCNSAGIVNLLSGQYNCPHCKNPVWVELHIHISPTEKPFNN